MTIKHNVFVYGVIINASSNSRSTTPVDSIVITLSKYCLSTSNPVGIISVTGNWLFAFAVTANATLVTTMKEIYKDKLGEAKHVDATEGQNTDPNMGQVDVILSDEFINSRF